MDDITVSKHHKYYSNKQNSLSKIVTKLLLSIILVLLSLIYIGNDNKKADLFKSKVLNNNFKYAKVKKLYNKYFGDIMPNEPKNDIMVFNDSINYSKIESIDNGEKVTLANRTIIEAIQSGIVVYLGEKDSLGYTVIIQGIDDTDVWYSNVTNNNLKLYDYVEKGEILGEANDYLLLNIIKDNKHIKYEEYIKNI